MTPKIGVELEIADKYMYIVPLLFQSKHNWNIVIDFAYPSCENGKNFMYINETEHVCECIRACVLPST